MCGIGFGINSTSTFEEIKNRGPDETKTMNVKNHHLVFHRLKINDLSGGSQPFVVNQDHETIYAMINGEIYNADDLQLVEKFPLQSSSDCEIIPHLFKKYGMDFLQMIQGEYAIVLLIQKDDLFKFYAVRDHVGVRPLFIGRSEHKLGICSEAKGLLEFDKIEVLEPRTIISSDWYSEFPQISQTSVFPLNYIPRTLSLVESWEDKLYSNLTRAVKQRLKSDRPFGALLSGGIDSSLICSLASRELKKVGKKLEVFTISLPNSTDLPFAKIVAKHIDAIHHVIDITPEEALEAIEETIYAIESFDTTTVRASTMQFLISKHISKKYDTRVILVGEMSDELFNGYLYSHYIKDLLELRNDAVRLVNDIHKFDGLRTDRTCAFHGLEVRLPFSDYQLIVDVLQSDLEKTMPKNGYEKYFLRNSFDRDNLLPKEVLWRRKEAFSDACSSKEKSWYQIIQEEIEKRVSDEEFNNRQMREHMNPMTKEQYYYRKIFEQRFGSKCETLIPYFWVPRNIEVINNEPSARAYF